MSVVAAVELPVRVDPGFAETLVDRRLRTIAGGDAAVLRRHADRSEALYTIADPRARESAFQRLALVEFEELGIADRIRDAIAARPLVRERVRQALLAEARGRAEEGVTWEPSGAHLGIKAEASRFDRPDGLAGWLEHVLGHAQDTLDAAFGFVPGRAEAVLPAPALARFHRMWDVAVDAARPDPDAPGRSPDDHRASIGADLPGEPGAVVDAVIERLAGRPRPTFAQLIGWSMDRSALIEAATGRRPEVRRDRCPLCGFPSSDVALPEASVAEAVRGEYPGWRPEEGLCGRCADRVRLAGRRGGGA